MATRLRTAAAVVGLAGWLLAVSIVVSRLGLLVHEVLGHGAAALAVGGSIAGLHLYALAGGWIEYGGSAAWSPAAVAVVSLGGIAVEWLAAAALALTARARAPGLGRVALAGAAWGLAIHGGLYLAIGTVDGVGDGQWLYRALGGARAVVVIPATIALVVGAQLAARTLGSALVATLPDAPRGRRAALLLGALALAAAVHGGAVAGELAVRADPSYARIMATERTRTIDREVAAWRAAQRDSIDAAAEAAARRAIRARHRQRSYGPLIAVAVAAAAVVGFARARSPGATPMPARALWASWVFASLAVVLVVAVDLVARAIC